MGGRLSKKLDGLVFETGRFSAGGHRAYLVSDEAEQELGIVWKERDRFPFWHSDRWFYEPDERWGRGSCPLEGFDTRQEAAMALADDVYTTMASEEEY
jgi:hypothetical protein